MNLLQKLSYLTLIPSLVASFGFKNNFNSLRNCKNNTIVDTSISDSTLAFNSISTNAINWIWKAPNQNVKRYTEDHSLSQISSGWYEVGKTFFNHIEIKFRNENYTKTISFDTVDSNSKENVESFSTKLINLGTTYRKIIFGKEFKNHKLDINFDSTFRFQTDDKSDLFNNITPIMFGKGFGHDPRYIGHIQFNSGYYPSTIKFLDVLSQKEESGNEYYHQKRSAFSQNSNQEYKLVGNLADVSSYPWQYNHPWSYMNYRTFKLASELLNNSNHHPYLFVDIQVDIALIKGTWYAQLFFIRKEFPTLHLPPSLKVLSVAHTNFSSIDLSNLINLEKLDLSYSLFGRIDVSHSLKLKYLNVSGNPLSEIWFKNKQQFNKLNFFFGPKDKIRFYS